MNDIKKCLKNLNEYQIDNIKKLLVAMKNNLNLKNQMDNFINENDNIETIKNKLNILNGKINFRNQYYIILINNFNQILNAYEKNVLEIKENNIKIQSIIYKNYSNKINNIFNLKEEIIDQQLIKLFEYDKFISNIQKM